MFADIIPFEYSRVCYRYVVAFLIFFAVISVFPSCGNALTVLVSSPSASGSGLEQVSVDIPDQKPALRTLTAAQSLLEGPMTEVVYDGNSLPPQAVPPWTRSTSSQIPDDLVEEVTAGGFLVQGTSQRPGRGMFYARLDPKLDGAKGWTLQIDGQATGAGFDNAFTAFVGNVGVGIRNNIGILFGPAGSCVGLGNAVCFPVYNGIGAVSLECKGNTIRFGNLTYTAVNGCGGGTVLFGTSASDRQYGALIRSIKYGYPSDGPRLQADGGLSRSRTVTMRVSPALAVRVTDAQGAPVPGVKVEFRQTRQPAGATEVSLSPSAGWSDQGGLVSVNAAVGNKVGEYEVKAACESCDPNSNSLTFLLTGTPAELVNYKGDAQLGAIGTTLAGPLIVRTSDQMTNTAVQNIGINFEVSAAGGATGQKVAPAAAATDGFGFAQTYLTLGDKPGDYAVKANSPDAGPEAEFKACAYLPNEDFKQMDPAWGATNYDNICSTMPAGVKGRPVYSCDDAIFKDNPKYYFSIRAKGCALSALATLINYYRDAYDLPISSVTPRYLNRFLESSRDTGCYSDKGGVNFECVRVYSPNIRLKKAMMVPGAARTDVISAAKKDLSKKIPVILQISNPTHFVLATGECGGSFIVSDPGSSDSGDIKYNPLGSRALIGIRRFEYVE